MIVIFLDGGNYDADLIIIKAQKQLIFWLIPHINSGLVLPATLELSIFNHLLRKYNCFSPPLVANAKIQWSSTPTITLAPHDEMYLPQQFSTKCNIFRAIPAMAFYLCCPVSPCCIFVIFEIWHFDARLCLIINIIFAFNYLFFLQRHRCKI